MTSWIVRPIRNREFDFLREMFFEAIYLPESQKKELSKDIVWHSELKKYHEKWGRVGDLALIAEDKIQQVPSGCVWGRLFTKNEKGYGFVDETTPELSIAVVTNYRNQGIGSMLLEKICIEYKKMKYAQVSLSVHPENISLRLYKRSAFKIIKEEAESITMIRTL